MNWGFQIRFEFRFEVTIHYEYPQTQLRAIAPRPRFPCHAPRSLLSSPSKVTARSQDCHGPSWNLSYRTVTLTVSLPQALER
eukprot:2324517-Rhodomonas_salina.1